MSTIAVIPARYASTRFPGKPLVKIDGVTMIERVYRQAAMAQKIDGVLVATDDQRIFDEVRRFGGEVIMTRDDHVSGTDRLAEVAAARPDIKIVVNVQGDEPVINPFTIDSAVAPLLSDPTIEMSTVAAPIHSTAEMESNDVVKVVLDSKGFALYFSRHPLPFYRDGRPLTERTHLAHVGLYVYRRETLLRLAALPPSSLELAECLEQLRALENGIRIHVSVGQFRSIAVDRPADVDAVKKVLQQDFVVSQTVANAPRT